MKILVPLLCLPLSGCVVVDYTDTIGRKFHYVAPAFGTKHIKRVDLTNGVMEGYSSEQASIVDFVKSMYDAGFAAGMKAAK